MKKKIKLLLIALVLIFVVYNFIGLFATNKSTIIAQLDTIEITKSFDGVVCKNETYIKFETPEGGMLDFSVAENEMVKKGKMVAVCYDSEIDEAKKKTLAEINRKIAEINSSPTSVGALEVDPQKLDKQIGEKILEIIAKSPERDVSSISAIKNDINVLLSRKLTTGGHTETAADTLESLRMEKQQIEREYGGKKTEIISSAHGIFSTDIDGYETILTPKKALSMTVSDMEAIKKGDAKKAPDATAIAKLVDNTNCWFSIVSDEKDAKEFSIGDKVNFRLGTDGDKVRSTVEYISMPEGGKCVVTFMTDDYSELFLTSRTISAVYVKNSYTGYKIPLGAIHVRKDKAGVYVKTDAGTKFREIDVIYKDDKIAIAKMDNLKPNGLLLYDEIVADWEE